MRDKKRIKPFLETIEKIWKQSPDLRFGQLINNVCGSEFLYYIEDNALLSAIKEFYKCKETPKSDTMKTPQTKTFVDENGKKITLACFACEKCNSCKAVELCECCFEKNDNIEFFNSLVDVFSSLDDE